MSTLSTLAENYRLHRDRNPLPADEATIEAIRSMAPGSLTKSGILLADCVSYEDGKPLHWHVFRVGPMLCVRLSTREEFAALSN